MSLTELSFNSNRHKIPSKTLMTIIILPFISWSPRNLRIQAGVRYGQPSCKHLHLPKAFRRPFLLFPLVLTLVFLKPFPLVSNSLESIQEQNQYIFTFSSGTSLIYFYLNCKDRSENEAFGEWNQLSGKKHVFLISLLFTSNGYKHDTLLICINIFPSLKF